MLPSQVEAAALFSKYDADQSGVLEEPEVRRLLQDLEPGGRPITDDELRWIFKVADVNKDGVINKNEVGRKGQATRHRSAHVARKLGHSTI